MASGRVPNTNITFFIKFVSNFSQITLLYNALIPLIEQITLIVMIAHIVYALLLNLLLVYYLRMAKEFPSPLYIIMFLALNYCMVSTITITLTTTFSPTSKSAKGSENF